MRNSCTTNKQKFGMFHFQFQNKENLRDGVVEGDHRTGHYNDIHNVPIISHVGTWV